MATPHVAGAAALYLEANPTASAGTVSSAITGGATAIVVGSAGSGSPNLLLYSLLTAAAPPPPTDPVAPVSAEDSAATTTGGQVTVNVLANDTDANGDELTVTNLTQPEAGGGGAVISDADTTVTYTAPGTAGTYTFTYTANDGTSDGNIATVTMTVTAPPAVPFSLTATGYKVKGRQKADLGWAGAGAAQVDVYRNGVKVATVDNVSPYSYTDHIDNKGGGSYTYKVCDAGTTTCSNEATVTF